MFGLERNKQAEDEFERNCTTFRILKDRYTGQSAGLTFKLHYDRETGLLYEVDAKEEPEINPFKEKDDF